MMFCEQRLSRQYVLLPADFRLAGNRLVGLSRGVAPPLPNFNGRIAQSRANHRSKHMGGNQEHRNANHPRTGAFGQD